MDNFDDLPYEEKVFTLVKNGAFINSINYYNQKVDLYHMNGIFVEVFYHPVSSTIHEIATAEPKRLHLYSPVDLNQS
ncbi:hypothetical protein [Chondrinema litorale]|uniref:hypothetical protein n=1 Tax=Chondrinema litorale TaxID=2994555 RepID=UPI0025437A19|nr:hypothetical protein [Chondrinema litorale]UZR99806.1 hypothetical protein OQ292_38540 [Chondrinema litorale]